MPDSMRRDRCTLFLLAVVAYLLAVSCELVRGAL